eukprot:TRINITY_DN56886_c0_g1_i1.p1 TRINITY_DN56886_c0_g1~~TRINITY_DN56886_c0_g1_i1.p1  ORF type:complete len:245 (-),score=60.38 TRINITY_DN56886_c0_g1_i1:16-750(-)
MDEVVRAESVAALGAAPAAVALDGTAEVLEAAATGASFAPALAATTNAIAPVREEQRDDNLCAATAAKQACEALGLEDFGRAAELYGIALRRCPGDAGLYADRAACWFALREPQQALEDCRRALLLDPRCFRAHERQAKALLALRAYERCCTAVDEALGSGAAVSATYADRARLTTLRRLAEAELRFGGHDFWRLTDLPKEVVTRQARSEQQRWRRSRSAAGFVGSGSGMQGAGLRRLRNSCDA